VIHPRKNAAVTGIEGLTTFDSYCTPDQFGKKRRKDFMPQPINAVVVNRWNDKVYPADKGPVFLTNGPVAFFSGIRVRKPMLKISSKDDVYRRRGLKPPE
jgi:hypothetical protein